MKELQTIAEENMEDFKLIGNFIKVEYNDCEYLYYFINYDENINIKTKLQNKLKDIQNSCSKFYCNSYELYEIINKQYDQFKITDQFLIKELFNIFQNKSDNNLIFANPNSFTIDTITTPSHISQVNKLKLLIDSILDIDNNINYDSVDKMIDTLQSLKNLEYHVNLEKNN